MPGYNADRKTKTKKGHISWWKMQPVLIFCWQMGALAFHFCGWWIYLAGFLQFRSLKATLIFTGIKPAGSNYQIFCRSDHFRATSAHKNQPHPTPPPPPPPSPAWSVVTFPLLQYKRKKNQLYLFIWHFQSLELWNKLHNSALMSFYEHANANVDQVLADDFLVSEMEREVTHVSLTQINTTASWIKKNKEKIAESEELVQH